MHAQIISRAKNAPVYQNNPSYLYNSAFNFLIQSYNNLKYNPFTFSQSPCEKEVTILHLFLCERPLASQVGAQTDQIWIRYSTYYIRIRFQLSDQDIDIVGYIPYPSKSNIRYISDISGLDTNVRKGYGCE